MLDSLHTMMTPGVVKSRNGWLLFDEKRKQNKSMGLVNHFTVYKDK